MQKKNGISYCLLMGTMLGAVRHGGFIPWDDDMDVAMMRPEYEKFREACKRDLDQSRFFYQDHTTDPHYRWGYARIRRKDTECVRLGQEHIKIWL
ncbi:LicD family protein [Brevibacillus choshinensis]|uniref:LicD family protein n=1 Tax=Brevibacillus choshinensis TaxID=54911 RepID=UPI0006EC1769|nr:LicD family protein [Brevibacillus choshinensis]